MKKWTPVPELAHVFDWIHRNKSPRVESLSVDAMRSALISGHAGWWIGSLSGHKDDFTVVRYRWSSFRKFGLNFNYIIETLVVRRKQTKDNDLFNIFTVYLNAFTAEKSIQVFYQLIIHKWKLISYKFAFILSIWYIFAIFWILVSKFTIMIFWLISINP